MTTAYTSLLGLALPVTGELSGTWGDTVNNSITSLVDTAVAGTTNVSADSNVTLTTTTGASNQARQAILLFSGARTAIRTVTAPAQSKIYTVINATTGGFAVQLVGAGPTTGVTIANGARTVVAWNGSDFVEVSSPSSIILPGGTANGVLYLNGSKVVTSGSALTYNGSTFKVAGTDASIITGFSGTTKGIRIETTSAGSSIGGVDSALINSFEPLDINGSYTTYSTSGTERMRLTSTGLGIGTSSPAVKLQVQGAASSNPEIRCLDGTVNSQWYAASDGTCVFGTYSNHPLVWRTNGSERARMDSSGRIAFGTQGTSSDRLFSATFAGATTSGSDQFGIVFNPTYPNTPTSKIYNIYSGPNLTAGTTIVDVYGYYLEAISAPGSTITNRYGLYQAGSSDKNYFAGNVTVNNGITFPATQSASANANTLDDYEEGTFTPQAADAGAGGTATTTGTGTYVKIGRTVTCNIRLAAISTSGMTGGSTFFIRGFPFPSENNRDQFAGAPIVAQVSTWSNQVTFFINGSNTYGYFVYSITSSDDVSIKVSNLNSNSASFYFNITYIST